MNRRSPPNHPQPPREQTYGVGLSDQRGGYIERESARPSSSGGDHAYQDVRPWGPQDGVASRQERGFDQASTSRHTPRRHDAVVAAADHGLGPDIAPQRDYRGRGPKSYQPSDERLKDVVSERLRDDPRVDASDITVDVTGGHVSLSGEVDTRRTKHLVEDLVDACRGVQQIDNRLRVRSAPTDAG